jgi:ectoine hydroxylase-related dioxygenase (phytanoyl-CoA dioxygenase family)
MVEANSGSDRLPGAVPMVCDPGDVVMANRQALHASFPNTSPDWRVTINFGFHRRSSVIDLETTYGEDPVVYDAERIFERSRLIAVGINARQQRFPQELRYVYQPMVGKEDDNRWNEATRENIVKDYNLRDLGI